MSSLRERVALVNIFGEGGVIEEWVVVLATVADDSVIRICGGCPVRDRGGHCVACVAVE